MCLKDFEESEVKIEKPTEMEKIVDCPLCLEPLEFDDKNFYPCTCGYQVCRFCWHRIRTNENGLCPACRRTYSENPANFEPLTPEELQRVKHQKKMKDLQKKQKIAENRKQLSNIRVIQKNLVFAVGLPLELSQDNQKKEKVLQMFRQFGPTHKEAITDRTTYAGSQGPSACVYITYQKPEDAVRAVKSLANTKIEGRTIKVSLGTTKYCSNFLRNFPCTKSVSDCLYLHELADEEASFTKEDIHLGKHLEYEQKLLEQTLNSISNKVNSLTNETSRTNCNRNVDNSSESSDDLQQSSSFYDSSEASDLSPSSNSQNLENRSIDSDLILETESSHQNTTSISSDARSTPSDSSSNHVFRSEENIIINNHSASSKFIKDLPQNNVNQGFSNPLKENESLHHANFLQNQIYENALHSRGQNFPSSNESNFLRLISNALGSNNDSSNLYPSIVNIKEQVDTESRKREDDPDLEFDPCQESLNALQDLMISEANEKARIHFEAMNRNPINHKSPTIPIYSHDGLAFKNTFNQPLKMRDPPPGFFFSNPQNLYKTSIDSGNSIVNKSHLGVHNPPGFRSNIGFPRCQPTGVALNNSSFVDYSNHSRDVQEISSPLLQQQQQHNQRLMNISQAQQFPVVDPRFSGVWSLSQQNQARPAENLFFNQSLAENRASNEFNLRMQQLRSNELRQWQQMNSNNNIPPFSDQPQPITSEQLAKVQAMYKAFEASQRNNVAGMGHRLSYTKKL